MQNDNPPPSIRPNGARASNRYPQRLKSGDQLPSDMRLAPDAKQPPRPSPSLPGQSADVRSFCNETVAQCAVHHKSSRTAACGIGFLHPAGAGDRARICTEQSNTLPASKGFLGKALRKTCQSPHPFAQRYCHIGGQRAFHPRRSLMTEVMLLDLLMPMVMVLMLPPQNSSRRESYPVGLP
jgi:hypothetical protein